MKNTICARGGRVHIEPVEGGDCVRLEVTTDGGMVASVLLDESSGGAIMFAIENSLELVALRKVRDCKDCAMRGCWARDDKPGVCLDFVKSEAAAVRGIAP